MHPVNAIAFRMKTIMAELIAYIEADQQKARDAYREAKDV
jgi:hypothetical protein